MAQDTGLDTRPLSELDVEAGVRPSAPRLSGLSDAQRRQGRHLAAIHRMHLRDVSLVARVLDAIEQGEAGAEDLQRLLGGLDMTHNLRQFGALCGRECQVLTFHHDAEENRVFPALEAGADPALKAVIQRLRHEHKIVHELLERLHVAAAALAANPCEDAFADARGVFRALERAVRSHFGYEETELEDVLGLVPAL